MLHTACLGGWDGKSRTTGIHIFDTKSGRWLPSALAEPFLRGFPKGGGLSGHALIPIETKNNAIKALVIGREGSLRMQRKTGCQFILKG